MDKMEKFQIEVLRTAVRIGMKNVKTKRIAFSGKSLILGKTLTKLSKLWELCIGFMEHSVSTLYLTYQLLLPILVPKATGLEDYMVTFGQLSIGHRSWVGCPHLATFTFTIFQVQNTGTLPPLASFLISSGGQSSIFSKINLSDMLDTKLQNRNEPKAYDITLSANNYLH